MDLGFIYTVAGGAFMIIIWGIRQEGRINALEREQDRQGKAHDALDTMVMQKLSAVEKSLSRIEGKLGIGVE